MVGILWYKENGIAQGGTEICEPRAHLGTDALNGGSELRIAQICDQCCRLPLSL